MKDPSHPPADFSTKPADGRVTMGFQRAPRPREPSGEEAAELAKLQGEWWFTSGEKDGEKFETGPLGPGSANPGHRLVFEGKERFVRSGPDAGSGILAETVREVTLDAAKTPPVMELRITRKYARARNLSQSNFATRMLSYKVDGDTLILCSQFVNAADNTFYPEGGSPPREAPPGELVTRPGDNRVLRVYKRIKPDPGDLKRLQGNWEAVSTEVDGQKQENQGIYQVEGDVWKSGIGKEFNSTGRITLDETRDPKVLTFRALGGGKAVAESVAIYRLDGDSLTLCIRQTADGRVTAPESFSSSNRQILMTLKRKAPIPQSDLAFPISKPVEPTNAPSPMPGAAPAAATAKADGPTGEEIAKTLNQEISRLDAQRNQLLDGNEDQQSDLDLLREEVRDLAKAIRDFEIKGEDASTPEGKQNAAENRKRLVRRRVEARENLQVLTMAMRKDRANAESLSRQIDELRARADEAALRPGKPNTAHVGDVIMVEVLEALPGRPVSGERVVRPDGTISLGFYGDLPVVGLTRAEMKLKVIERMRKYITDESLGLVALGEDGKMVKVAPADSDRVYVDDMPYRPRLGASESADRSNRPAGVGPRSRFTAPGTPAGKDARATPK